MHLLSSCFANCAQHVSAAASLRVGMHCVSEAFTVLRGVPQWSVVVVVGDRQTILDIPQNLLVVHRTSSLQVTIVC